MSVDTAPSPAASAPAPATHLLSVLGATRSGLDARLIEAARMIVAVTGDELLAHKGFSSVDELTASQRRSWRAEAKSVACEEVRAALGCGITEARHIVGMACAPLTVRTHLLGALDRGEASLVQARAFWKRCGALPVEDAEAISESLFGSDPATAVPERLDPDDRLKDRPWHDADFTAAVEREAVRAEGKDVVAERERRRRAYAARRAEMMVCDDGTGMLTLTGPLVSMVAIHARIDRVARLLRKKGDPRTLDQLRLDTSAALLLHGELSIPAEAAPPAPEDDHDLSVPDLAGISAVLAGLPSIDLQVVIPWDALAGQPACTRCTTARTSTVDGGAGPRETDDRDGSGVGDEPASAPPPTPPRPGGDQTSDPGAGQTADPGTGQEGAGVGLVLGRHPAFLSPGHLRELALLPGTTLHRLLVDPADGRLIERSTPAYRPDAVMRRQILAADVVSRAPGSRQPAAVCELDHVTPFGTPGGVTSETNLVALAQRPHHLKTAGTAISVINERRDLTWTTLLGQCEATRVHDYRQYSTRLREAIDRLAPLTQPPTDGDGKDSPHPQHSHPHPAERADLDARRDLVCRALYAALAHRDPRASLVDHDDHVGATAHGGALGGWMFVTRTTEGGKRRHGPNPDTPPVSNILGVPVDTDTDVEPDNRREAAVAEDTEATQAEAANPQGTEPQDEAPPF